jgi:hypothetical protein
MDNSHLEISFPSSYFKVTQTERILKPIPTLYSSEVNIHCFVLYCSLITLDGIFPDFLQSGQQKASKLRQIRPRPFLPNPSQLSFETGYLCLYGH